MSQYQRNQEKKTGDDVHNLHHDEDSTHDVYHELRLRDLAMASDDLATLGGAGGGSGSGGFKEFELDSHYRSVGTEGRSVPVEFNVVNQSIHSKQSTGHSVGPGPTVFTTANKTAPKVELEVVSSSFKSAKTNSKSKSSRPITAPAEPFYVAPSTHFLTNQNVGDIKARVELELDGMDGVSYEFFFEKCRWEGVYLVSSSRCKFEINVYKRTSGGFVVEGNRLCGESIAFITVYQAVRNLFVTPPLTSTWSSFTPTAPPRRTINQDEEMISLNAVFSMARCPVGEAQLSAAQIFCDMTKDTSKHSFLIQNHCVPVLVKLMQVDFQSCNQHAICALAHLSSSLACQELLRRDTDFLQALLPLCSADGNYNSVEMRRECARLLANISSCGEGAQDVVSSAGQQNVASFLMSVDDLKDDRLRLHADRARLSLASCT